MTSTTAEVDYAHLREKAVAEATELLGSKAPAEEIRSAFNRVHGRGRKRFSIYVPTAKADRRAIRGLVAVLGKLEDRFQYLDERPETSASGPDKRLANWLSRYPEVDRLRMLAAKVSKDLDAALHEIKTGIPKGYKQALLPPKPAVKSGRRDTGQRAAAREAIKILKGLHRPLRKGKRSEYVRLAAMLFDPINQPDLQKICLGVLETDANRNE